MVIPFFISLYPTISHYITTFSDAIFWGTQNSAMSFPSISLRGWRSPGSFPLPKYLAGHHIRCTAMTWIWWNWRFLHGYYDTNHGKTMVCGAPHSPVFPEKILRNVRIGKKTLTMMIVASLIKLMNSSLKNTSPSQHFRVVPSALRMQSSVSSGA